MPDVEAPVRATIKFNDPRWFKIVWLIEDQQFDVGGATAVDGEVHTILSDGASEWMR